MYIDFQLVSYHPLPVVQLDMNNGWTCGYCSNCGHLSCIDSTYNSNILYSLDTSTNTDCYTAITTAQFSSFGCGTIVPEQSVYLQ